MHKIFSCIFIISISFMVGCSDSTTYNNDDVAAVVRGEEITVGDIRFFVEIQDEDFPKAVEAKVRETIVIQEAKKMNINVSDEVKKSVEHFRIYPPDDVDTEQANKIRDFAESQAEKFHMEPEEFHKKFVKRSAERSAYQNAFFKEHLGKPDTHEEAEEMNEEIQLIVDGLMEKHEDEIEILIN